MTGKAGCASSLLPSNNNELHGAEREKLKEKVKYLSGKSLHFTGNRSAGAQTCCLMPTDSQKLKNNSLFGYIYRFTPSSREVHLRSRGGKCPAVLTQVSTDTSPYSPRRAASTKSVRPKDILPVF